MKGKEDRRQRLTAVPAVSGIRNAQEFERSFKGKKTELQKRIIQDKAAGS